MSTCCEKLDRLTVIVESIGARVLHGDFVLRDGSHSPLYVEWPNGMRSADVRRALGVKPLDSPETP